MIYWKRALTQQYFQKRLNDRHEPHVYLYIQYSLCRLWNNSGREFYSYRCDCIYRVYQQGVFQYLYHCLFNRPDRDHRCVEDCVQGCRQPTP